MSANALDFALSTQPSASAPLPGSIVASVSQIRLSNTACLSLTNAISSSSLWRLARRPPRTPQSIAVPLEGRGAIAVRFGDLAVDERGAVEQVR